MAKSPYTPEWKITIIKQYFSGEGSYEGIANAHGIGSKTLKDWVHRYKEQGAAKHRKIPDSVCHAIRYFWGYRAEMGACASKVFCYPADPVPSEDPVGS